MKTQSIINALRASNTPAASLARYLKTPLARRLYSNREARGPAASLKNAYRAARSSDSWELSSPEAENPLLWISPKDSRVTDWQGREFLDHCGWFQDEFQDETLETCAVILAPFPRIVFYAVRCSMSGEYRVHLDEWEEIDFSECESDYDAQEAIRETVKSVIRGNERATQREAEDSVEYYRKDRIGIEIVENRETLKTLRQSIRALAGELKAFRQSRDRLGVYPCGVSQAAARDLCRQWNERAGLMRSNRELAASL